MDELDLSFENITTAFREMQAITPRKPMKLRRTIKAFKPIRRSSPPPRQPAGTLWGIPIYIDPVGHSRTGVVVNYETSRANYVEDDEPPDPPLAVAARYPDPLTFIRDTSAARHQIRCVNCRGAAGQDCPLCEGKGYYEE